MWRSLTATGAARGARAASLTVGAALGSGVLGKCVGWLGPRLLIAPGSNFRLVWDSLSMILVIYIAAVLPYRIAFVNSWSLESAS